MRNNFRRGAYFGADYKKKEDREKCKWNSKNCGLEKINAKDKEFNRICKVYEKSKNQFADYKEKEAKEFHSNKRQSCLPRSSDILFSTRSCPELVKCSVKKHPFVEKIIDRTRRYNQNFNRRYSNVDEITTKGTVLTEMNTIHFRGNNIHIVAGKTIGQHVTLEVSAPLDHYLRFDVTRCQITCHHFSEHICDFANVAKIFSCVMPNAIVLSRSSNVLLQLVMNAAKRVSMICVLRCEKTQLHYVRCPEIHTDIAQRSTRLQVRNNSDVVVRADNSAPLLSRFLSVEAVSSTVVFSKNFKCICAKSQFTVLRNARVSIDGMLDISRQWKVTVDGTSSFECTKVRFSGGNWDLDIFGSAVFHIQLLELYQKVCKLKTTASIQSPQPSVLDVMLEKRRHRGTCVVDKVVSKDTIVVNLPIYEAVVFVQRKNVIVTSEDDTEDCVSTLDSLSEDESEMLDDSEIYTASLHTQQSMSSASL